MEERVDVLMNAVDRFYGSEGDGDRAHTHAVWLIASTICSEENVDEETRLNAEMGAIVHDMACPLCRSLTGKCDGKDQETHSEEVLRPFFASIGWSGARVERLIEIASRHHTYSPSDSLDEQIVKEADAIVNLSSGDEIDISLALWYGANVFRTKTGLFLLHKLIQE